MTKPGRMMVLASAGVEAAGNAPFVTGFVVVSEKLGSRVFKVSGPAPAPTVTELPPATTIDLARFQRQVSNDVEPLLEAKRDVGEAAAMTTPADEVFTDAVTAHLQKELPS
ncbi:MAG TPA: hypothetical protein VF407_21500 [Polyangiaceae bacterium]